LAATLLDCADSEASGGHDGKQPRPPREGGSGNAQPVRPHALLRVLHAPAVALRAAPSMDAPLLGMAKRDEVLAADSRRGRWCRLSNLVHPPPSRDANHMWVLLLHDTLGVLCAPLDAAELHALPEAAAEALVRACMPACAACKKAHYFGVYLTLALSAVARVIRRTRTAP
jgi:hypothetical protein